MASGPISSVQLLSPVQIFVTPWTATHQASLSITTCWSLPKPMSTEWVMPSNHLISVALFSSCPQSFPTPGSFQMSQLFLSGSQSIRVSASTSGPITSCQIDRETVETVADFNFRGSKITEDGDCSHESKRYLLLGRKVMTNLDSILKSRDITLPTMVHLVGYGFYSSHVWMWELDYKESWVLKNWWFWIVVLEKTLESPLTARRSNQSILNEISPGCSLEELILKLKLQYFGYLMQRAGSFEKTLMLGKIEGRRRG